jgi:hypothetical protein
MHARPIGSIVLAIALGLGLSGCVDNDVSIRLESACFPPEPNADGSCSYPSSCSSVLLGNPAVDVGYGPTAGTLVWPVQVGNQMVTDADRAGGANSKDAWIERYTIRYASGQVSVPSVTVPITRHLVPANGRSVVIVPVVPTNVATFLAGALVTTPGPYEISAEIVAKGHLADGSSFETGPFTMVFTATSGTYATPDPIGLCNGGDPAGTVPYVGSCPQEGQTALPGCGG